MRAAPLPYPQDFKRREKRGELFIDEILSFFLLFFLTTSFYVGYRRSYHLADAVHNVSFFTAQLCGTTSSTLFFFTAILYETSTTMQELCW